MSEDIDELIERAMRARSEGQIPVARELLRGAVDLLRLGNDRLALATALRNLGEVERGVPESDGGVAAYEESVAILRREPSPLKLAHTVRHLADIHRHHASFSDAAGCYDEALAIYHSRPDAPALDVANALRGMALLKEQVGLHDEATTLWQEAHELYKAAGVHSGTGESAARVARLPPKPQSD